MTETDPLPGTVRETQAFSSDGGELVFADKTWRTDKTRRTTW
ncbi:hypothetical protein ACFY7H_22370 [Streptomyces sp. NPDC012794]